MAAKYCPDAASVLDVGCGTGFILEFLRARHPRAAIVGCDFQWAPLAIARSRVRAASFLQASALHPPFERQFDLIVALDVIEHIDDDAAALAAVASALRPGGVLIITVPQHPRLWSEVDDFSHHRRRYTWRELEGKARSAGLQVIRRTSFFTLTLPLLLASRLRRAKTFDPAAEFRIPRWINAVLERCIDWESWWIRAGITLPVGGSLLLVARRPQ
jgi:SAM-dependent methyltransferase